MTGPDGQTGAAQDASFLNYLFFLAVITVVAAILTVAMTLQYAKGELPCPLCLLERLAMFGICFGIILNFRYGFSYRNTGISLLFTVLLLLVSSRQTLLDITPRPGHEYIGSAVLGLHMPVWSVIIALCILTAYALKMAVLGDEKSLTQSRVDAFPALGITASLVSLYVGALALINTVSVFVQCGLNECHTFNYQMLQ